MLYSASFIIGLICFGAGFGGYAFTSERMERLQFCLGTLLFSLIWFLFYYGPLGKLRSRMLMLLWPSFLFAFLGCITMVLGSIDEYPPCTFFSTTVGRTVFKLVGFYDVSYYDFGRFGVELVQEQYVLGGKVKKTRSLIRVIPSNGASLTVIDGGKRVRFISKKLAGRAEIVREFSTDFEKNLESGCVNIGLTKAEQLKRPTSTNVKLENNKSVL